MCGIGGIVRTDGGPVSERDLATLIERLRHRGPDGEKLWLAPGGGCGFVHLRLAILDTDPRADQPMTSADGALTIIHNGEIFNFLELRDELERGGARFRTEGDTEVLLEAWRAWGPEMLSRLNGMWAFVIRDNRTGDLFCARDRFGIKPFLYAEGGGHFAFASEMRALAALPFVDTAIDPDVASRLLFEPMGVEGSARTIHRHVRRLPAGHYAILSDGRLDVRRWWHTLDHLPPPPRTIGEAGEQFRALFLDSVRLRMRSDVRIGTCLSGGFDSTAVVSGMAHVAADAGSHARESDDWRHAFVASFPGLPHDETEQARLAADHARVVAHVHDFSADDGPELAETVLDALDDVYISLPTAVWKIYRAVRGLGIRVSLDGHGADELMGAYYSPDSQLAFAIRNRISNQAGASPVEQWLSDRARLLGFRLQNSLFLRRHRRRPPARLPIAALDDRLPDQWGLLNRRLYGMFHGNVLPTILRNFDRLSMAHGIEVRMPFMDWRLVTYVMSLPDEMKAGDGATKRVAREAMRGLMPEAIRTSPRKVGFNSQMPAWLNGSLGRWALDVVGRGGDDLFDELVDRKSLAARIDALNRRQEWNWTNSGRLWPYINLKWYLDRQAAGARAAETGARLEMAK
jgi:asparagine synthase (glutamine-hydrolysing)